MKRSLIVVSVVSLLCGGLASAAVHTGEIELAGSGSFISTNSRGTVDGGASSTLWSLNALLGYFVNDNIEVALGGNGEWMKYGEEEKSRWDYGLGPVVKYHFMPSNLWVPYIGAQAQWEWSNPEGGLRTVGGSQNGLMYGPLAGLRFELNAKNDFFVEYQYRVFTGGMDDVYNCAHAVLIGLSHQFR
jgi:hypothetical protein